MDASSQFYLSTTTVSSVPPRHKDRKRKRGFHTCSSDRSDSDNPATGSEPFETDGGHGDGMNQAVSEYDGRRRHLIPTRRSNPPPDVVTEISRLGLPQEFHDSLAAKMQTDKTLESYEKHYSRFDAFCAMINDHKSRIILLDKAPKRSPPINPETIILYCKYRRLAKGTIIMCETGEPLLDLCQNIVQAVGGWNAPINETQFKSALSIVHKLRGHDGTYADACVTCMDKYNENSGSSNCLLHQVPLLLPSGNPTLSKKVREYFANLSQSTTSYIPHTSQSMNPWQYQKLITYLVTQNRPTEFMIAVMITLAVNLFLREDEVSSLKFEDILWNISHCNPDNTIELICIKLREKADKYPTLLLLWRNRRCPYLCPVNLLLWWLSTSGIRSGYLFPPAELLQSLPVHIDNRISYETFLHVFKKSMKAVEGSQSKENDASTLMHNVANERKWGTHCCRKTAFTIAMLGGASDSNLILSARMKSVQTLTKYRNDCAKLKAYADTAGRGFKHIVDDYRSQILLRQSLSNDIISSANAATSSTAISLWLSKYPSGSSFFRILDTWIHLTDNQRLQTEFFCRLESFKALMNSVTVQNPKDIHKLKTQLSSLLSSLRATQFSGISLDSSTNSLSALLGSSVESVVSNLAVSSSSDQPCIHTNPVPQDSNPIASYQQSIDSHPHSSCQSTSEIVTLRKRAIKNSRNKPVKVQIDEMLKLMDRVDGYKRLVNGADGTRGIVDNGSRTWVLQTLRPIINCYRNCCNSDIECFRRYNGESIKFAKFKHCALRASSESIVS